MNQKVGRQIRRLYRCLLHMTSLGRAEIKACNALSARFQNVSWRDAREAEEENIMSGRRAIFDSVIGFLHGGAVCRKAVFAYEFRTRSLEIFSYRRLAVNDASTHPRKIEKSQKKGFDVLRVTLNLARGNIETNVFKPAPLNASV